MEGIAVGLNSLYRQFVLRDLVGKVLPGLVAGLGAASLLFRNPAASLVRDLSDLHAAVIAALFVGAWAVGFGVQTLLDIIKAVLALAVRTIFPDRVPTLHRCLDTLRPTKDGWVKTVARRTRLSEEGQVALERLAVVKEACGNTALAVPLFLILGSSHSNFSGAWWGLGIGLALLLGWRHLDACRREVLLQREKALRPPRQSRA